ncbi:hypothetical protein [Kaistella yonginensis]|uniref:hypothetical protein n=1 Tax=Kaistella yonginensis TaxID=658267 RepID=UPI0025B4DB44|nr:hypothetical protein [Kaistella yonginensis]MDN3605559.1 hypothetical protein [Kaistella yonginensis]
MGIDKKYIGKVTENNLDDWLHSTGFVFPQTKIHIERFNKLYEDYDFKLKNTSINVKSIIDGSFCLEKEPKIISIDSNISLEIQSLKMVARKGQSGISQSVIDKMKQNQKKKNGDR